MGLMVPPVKNIGKFCAARSIHISGSPGWNVKRTRRAAPYPLLALSMSSFPGPSLNLGRYVAAYFKSNPLPRPTWMSWWHFKASRRSRL